MVILQLAEQGAEYRQHFVSRNLAPARSALEAEAESVRAIFDSIDADGKY